MATVSPGYSGPDIMSILAELLQRQGAAGLPPAGSTAPPMGPIMPGQQPIAPGPQPMPPMSAVLSMPTPVPASSEPLATSAPHPTRDSLAGDRSGLPPLGAMLRLPPQPPERGIGSDYVASPPPVEMQSSKGIGSDYAASPPTPQSSKGIGSDYAASTPAAQPFTTSVTPEPAVNADAIVSGAQAAAAGRGPPSAPAASAAPTSSALRQPGLFDYIDTALAGMAGGSPVLSTLGDRFDARNATYTALTQRGASPELARAIVMNPTQFAPIMPSLFSPRTQVVNNRLVDTASGRVIADFSDRFVPLPADSPGALNTATGAVAATGTGAGREERARQEAVGKARGEAQANLPGAIQTAQTALGVIDRIRRHPGRSLGTGATGILPGIPGTEQRDFIALLDQAKGQAFLEAFHALKGGGAITEVEGQKATQAIARLERTQTEEGFLEALADLEGVIRRGMAVARQRAAQPGSGTGAAGGATRRYNPSTGALE